MMQELIRLEEQGWQALTEERYAGRTFYRSVLRDDAVMLFPGGLLLAGKENILATIGPQPWQSFQMEEVQTISLSEDAGVIVYRVTAQHNGPEPYVALISSTYARNDGKWQLVLHQQTPV
jgi:hypothetical protein